MKKVPFFANTADDSHCVQAAFKMILKYFYPDRDFSFAQLDTMSLKRPGMGTWWLPLLAKISQLGLMVKDIEPFDYQRYYKEGETYIKEFYPSEAADYHANRTNLKYIKSLIPEFIKKVELDNRAARLSDIKDLLNEQWLCAVALNSRVLNGRPGFSGHVVVVYDYKPETDHFYVHDPGLPAHKNLPIPSQKFEAAFFSAGRDSAALVGVKRAL